MDNSFQDKINSIKNDFFSKINILRKKKKTILDTYEKQETESKIDAIREKILNIDETI